MKYTDMDFIYLAKRDTWKVKVLRLVSALVAFMVAGAVWWVY